MRSFVHASCVLLLGLCSARSSADRLTTAEPGTYVGETNAPTTGPFSEFECPGTLTVNGTSVVVPLSAKVYNTRFSYGSVTVDLKAGSYHDTVKLPERKIGAATDDESPYEKYYRTVKQVRLNIDTIEIAGGAHGLLLIVQHAPGVELPPDEWDRAGCRRVLIARSALKSSAGGKSKWDGTYWPKSGGGGGVFTSLVHSAAIAGGKISILSLNGYHSWFVNEAPIGPDGKFEVKLKIPKPPSPDALTAAFYEPDTIKSFRDDLSFTISGKIGGAADAATSKRGLVLDVSVASGVNGDSANTELFHTGFNTSTSIVTDCNKLTAEQRKLHGSCD